MMNDTELLARAREWAARDPDPETRAELQGLIDARELGELAERMAGELEFGTAGLRGVLGAGSARMNRAVVIRATRGVAEYLLHGEPDARTLPVVVGHDARHYSRELAECAAGVLVAAGLPVRYFPEPVPTPLVAYAAAQLGATAAIAITASHNPPEYGGFKLFDRHAAQIAPPIDQQVAACIARAPAASDVGCAEGVFRGEQPRAEPIPDALFDRYLCHVDAIRPVTVADRGLRIAYTPLHGVGWRYAQAALRHAGYEDLHVVTAQADPDPDFPTTAFPNPEEDDAMERVVALAGEVRADLVLCNDPDADRLAVAVPTPAGRIVRLSGNQVGVLLADFLLEHSATGIEPLLVSTLVSSPMLESIAAARGARVEWTLTGFKWMMRAARELERDGRMRLVLAYEEAIGYSAGSVVRDKDGISAAILVADLAAECRAKGQTVLERLGELYAKHGLWASAGRCILETGPEGRSRIERAMHALAGRLPVTLGGREVRALRDYSVASSDRPAWRSVAPLLYVELEDGCVRVRPSGTEPKLKIYVDLRFPIVRGDWLGESEQQGRRDCEAIADQVASLLIG